MFEILINLILTGLFLHSQEALPSAGPMAMEYRLPPAETRCFSESQPYRDKSDSVGVKITAQSALVIDKETGKILFEKNSGEVRSIASITKLMTSLVALDYIKDLNKVITISGSDYRPGAKNYLLTGDQVKAKDVLHTALVASANEAAVAIARSTGLTSEDFVKAMNKKAVDLKMTKTHFSDSTGLSNDNQSTAHDITILLRTVLDHKILSDIISSKQYSFEVLNKGIERKVVSTDKILGQDFGINNEVYEVDAGKTGYVEKAGYCFTSQVSNKNNGQKILVAVLGSDTVDARFTDTKSLAYWVFNNYTWK